MLTIQTETIRIKAAPDVDPFSVYRMAVERFGAEHVFLAESVSGPEIDCKQSFVAIRRIASIRFTADSVNIDAAPEIRGHLTHTAETLPDAPRFDPDGRADLDSPDQLWRLMRAFLFSSYRVATTTDEFAAGFVVRLDYDTAALIERLPRRLPRTNATLVRLDLYQHVVAFHRDRVALHVNYGPGFGEPDIPSLRQLLTAAPPFRPAAPEASGIRFSTTKERYLDACRTALDHIHAGDIYQVQLGHEIRVRTGMDPVSLYAHLRAQNPSPYMFLHQVDDMTLVGASPENYVRLEGRRLSMRPIAGTLAKSPAVDGDTLRRELCASVKENAEHVMLVDLCRNDIGRLCEPGSLDVPSLMAMEEFPSLYHLVSTVTGELRAGCDAVDVLRATFPAGTMVGAPKIRAMEIIEQLEASPRGQYAGAIGLIDFRGGMNMALCIRMACRIDGEYRLRASAGVVFDSEPEREWLETLAKMRLAYRILTGQELVA
ncbi:hypothetical protein BZL54_22450 [Burkholderia ubonensis subsp. mesacidophila]|uniref:Anthranilate synthase n=2 Tax=Burkholderia ubonensis TaxID=101571 RepID=A0A2A4FA00_9BURK|nr:hypothetical protein BZL54_22450 [Burkholderia ubonensis subsp. mesacidophila]